MPHQRGSSAFDEDGDSAPAAPSRSNSGRLPSLTPASKNTPSATLGAGAKRGTVIGVGGGRSSSKLVSRVEEQRKPPDTLKTPLHSSELAMADEMWNAQVTGGFVTSLSQLNSLLYALQIPQQPIITKLVKEKFTERSHFSFQDFLFLLEQCKTIHIRWLHKIQGKALDDDLLEAFVAVGGEEDSGGQVDMDQMKNVIAEFHLSVDLNQIVPPARRDTRRGSESSLNLLKKEKEVVQPVVAKNLHFGGFAQLLKDQRRGEGRKLPSLQGAGGNNTTAGNQSNGGGHRDDDDYLMEDDIPTGGRPVDGGVNGESTPPLLSTMEFFEDDIEVGADGIVRHRPPPAHDPMGASGLGSRKSIFFGGGGGESLMMGGASRLHRQTSGLAGVHREKSMSMSMASPNNNSNSNALPLASMTPEPGVTTRKNRRQFGGMGREARSPHKRSKTTEPSSPSNSKLVPIRQLTRGPKKPKYANW